MIGESTRIRVAVNRSPAVNLSSGFTLIELMIVVAVVAILAAIALPNFNESVRKSKRGQAKADMVELAQMAERYHSVQNSYVGFWGTVPATRKISPATGGTTAYLLQEVETANTFTLTAVPQNGQVKDTRCGTLGLSNTGEKTKNGTGVLSDCW